MRQSALALDALIAAREGKQNAFDAITKVLPWERFCSTVAEAEARRAQTNSMPTRCWASTMLASAGGRQLSSRRSRGEIAGNPQILMASLLADGLNLGLTRMAEACSIASLGQLAWTSEWHIRDETYALALQRLVNQQQREPLAAMFGDAGASSSYGQFFRAGGQGRAAANLGSLHDLCKIVRLDLMMNTLAPFAPLLKRSSTIAAMRPPKKCGSCLLVTF